MMLQKRERFLTRTANLWMLFISGRKALLSNGVVVERCCCRKALLLNGVAVERRCLTWEMGLGYHMSHGND